MDSRKSMPTIDLINHDAWNLYQIAKVYLVEYDKLA
jgi:hypothetical protein